MIYRIRIPGMLIGANLAYMIHHTNSKRRCRDEKTQLVNFVNDYYYHTDNNTVIVADRYFTDGPGSNASFCDRFSKIKWCSNKTLNNMIVSHKNNDGIIYHTLNSINDISTNSIAKTRWIIINDLDNNVNNYKVSQKDYDDFETSLELAMDTESKKYVVELIDARDCNDISHLTTLPPEIRPLIANQIIPGKYLAKKLRDDGLDKLILLGKHDQSLTESIKLAFGDDVIIQCPHIENVLDKMFTIMPFLFVRDISPDDVETLITSPKNGNVAMVYTCSDAGKRQPKATGGNYICEVYEIDDDPEAPDDDNYIDKRLVSKLVDAIDADGVVFVGRYSFWGRDNLPTYFMEELRKRNISMNVYTMTSPRTARFSNYDADNITTIKL